MCEMSLKVNFRLYTRGKLPWVDVSVTELHVLPFMFFRNKRNCDYTLGVNAGSSSAIFIIFRKTNAVSGEYDSLILHSNITYKHKCNNGMFLKNSMCGPCFRHSSVTLIRWDVNQTPARLYGCHGRQCDVPPLDPKLYSTRLVYTDVSSIFQWFHWSTKTPIKVIKSSLPGW